MPNRKEPPARVCLDNDISDRQLKSIIHDSSQRPTFTPARLLRGTNPPFPHSKEFQEASRRHRTITTVPSPVLTRAGTQPSSEKSRPKAPVDDLLDYLEGRGERLQFKWHHNSWPDASAGRVTMAGYEGLVYESPHSCSSSRQRSWFTIVVAENLNACFFGNRWVDLCCECILMVCYQQAAEIDDLGLFSEIELLDMLTSHPRARVPVCPLPRQIEPMWLSTRAALTCH